MARVITRFGDDYDTAEALPLYNGRQQVTVEASSSLVQLPSGVFDYRYGDKATPEPERLQVAGEWAASSAEDMEDKAQALFALRGIRSRLWRVGISEDTQWRWARCLRVETLHVPGTQLSMEFRLVFDLHPSPWVGEDQGDSVTLATSPQNVALDNDGDAEVLDAVLTVTAGSTAITQLDLVVSGATAIRWTGTLASGEELEIDCGRRTIRREGADVYSGFALQSAHVIPSWLRIDPGGITLTVTLAGGGTDSTLSWEYGDAWA